MEPYEHKDNADLSHVHVVRALPDYFGSERGDPVPADLVGAEIVQFGTLAEIRKVEGGGLVIDYRPHGANEDRRVVFALSELGMWVVYSGPLKNAPRQTERR